MKKIQFKEKEEHKSNNIEDRCPVPIEIDKLYKLFGDGRWVLNY